MERFEDDLLLLDRNADPGIADLKGDDPRSAIEHRVIGAPAGRSRFHTEYDATLRGEFERIGEQILQYLLEALEIGVHAERKLRIHFDLEVQVPRFSHMPEAPLHGFAHLREENFLGLDRDRAGFDL